MIFLSSRRSFLAVSFAVFLCTVIAIQVAVMSRSTWAVPMAGLLVSLTYVAVCRPSGSIQTLRGWHPSMADLAWSTSAGAGLGALCVVTVATTELTCGFSRYNTTPPVLASVLMWHAVLFVAVAVSEELLFRVVVPELVVGTIGTETPRGARWSVWASALLFSLAHGFNPGFSLAALANLFLAGLALSALKAKLGIAAAIGFHWAWNQSLVLCGMEVSGLAFGSVLERQPVSPAWLVGGAFGPEEGLLVTCVLLALFVSVHKLFDSPVRVTRDPGLPTTE